MNLSYSFYVTVHEDGSSSPMFAVFPPKYGEYLGCLVGRTSVSSIKHDIKSIESVIFGEKDFTWITDGGDCEFEVKSETTTLKNYYKEFPSISVPTSFLMLLYKDWLLFVNKYHDGKIPGLIPESKLDTWTAVPNEYIKDEYWKTHEKPDV